MTSQRICSHQPAFFPWAGYWNKVARSDLLIVSAGVKMDYGGYQNRVAMNGTWWTVPVRKGAKHLPIKDVRFDPAGWEKALHTARQALGGKRKPNGALVRQILEDTVTRLGASDFLLDLNLSAFAAVQKALGLSVRVIVDEIEPLPEHSKTERLMKRVMRYARPGDTYLGGAGLLEYLTPEHWHGGLKLEVQERTDESVDNGTVMQLIAQDEEPLETIKTAFCWRPIDVRQEHPGDCAAFG